MSKIEAWSKMDVMVKTCFVAILTLMLAFGVSKAECPTKDTLMQHADECLSDIKYFHGMGMTEGLKKRAVEACKNDAYKDALSCLKDIYDACVDLRVLMKQLFSFDRIDEEYKYICSNLQVFTENTQCIANADLNAKPCIEAETKIFWNESSKTLETSNEIEDWLPVLCKWVKKLVVCSNKAYADQVCGDKVEDLRTSLISIVIPPVCTSWSTNTALSSTKAAFSSTKATLSSTKAAFSSTKATLSSTNAAFSSTKATLSSTKAAFSSTNTPFSSTKVAFSSTNTPFSSTKAAFSSTKATLSSTNTTSSSTTAASSSTKAASSSTNTPFSSTKAAFLSTKAAFSSINTTSSSSQTASSSTKTAFSPTKAASFSTEAASTSTQAASWLTKADASAIIILALISSIFVKM